MTLREPIPPETLARVVADARIAAAQLKAHPLSTREWEASLALLTLLEPRDQIVSVTILCQALAYMVASLGIDPDDIKDKLIDLIERLHDPK